MSSFIDNEEKKNWVRATRIHKKNAKWIRTDGLEKRKTRSSKWTDKTTGENDLGPIDKMPSQYYKYKFIRNNAWHSNVNASNSGKMKPTCGKASSYNSNPTQQQSLLSQRRALLEMRNIHGVDYCY